VTFTYNLVFEDISPETMANHSAVFELGRLNFQRAKFQAYKLRSEENPDFTQVFEWLGTATSCFKTICAANKSKWQYTFMFARSIETMLRIIKRTNGGTLPLEWKVTQLPQVKMELVQELFTWKVRETELAWDSGNLTMGYNAIGMSGTLRQDHR